MILGRACSLRTPNWTEVDARRLLEGIKQDHREGTAKWTFTPWCHRAPGRRSFLIHSTDGDIYAIFFSPQ